MTRNLWRRLCAAGLLGLLAVALLAAAAQPAAAAKSRHPKPTVVLVHGAWADSSSWCGVVERLQHRGYTVGVPPNPLRGLSSDSAYLASYLGAISGPIVLVGHSYGGAVITNAATGDSDVKALVYIDGFAPDQGETVVQLATARPGSAIGGAPATVFDTVPIPGAPGDVDRYVKKSVSRPRSRTTCRSRPPRFWPPSSDPSRSARSSRPPAFPPGRRSRAGTSSAPPTTSSRPPSSDSWPSAPAPTRWRSASHRAMVSRPGAVTRLILVAAETVE
jgi:pimeloyl-ACP methyl ester carboxylesterase